MNKSTDICWYPLRVTYSRELQLKEVLDAECIENFIPMHYEYVKQGERKIRKLVPVVHNLVFVHSSFACIDRVKQSLGSSLSVRYIIDRETNRPLIVRIRRCIALSLFRETAKNRLFILIRPLPLYGKEIVCALLVVFSKGWKELLSV